MHDDIKIPQISREALDGFVKFMNTPEMKLFRDIVKETETGLDDLDDNERAVISATREFLQNIFVKKREGIDIDITMLESLKRGILELKKKKANIRDIHDNLLKICSFDDVDYEERCVLFLDILGAEDTIASCKEIDVRKVSDLLCRALNNINKCAETLGVELTEDLVQKIKYVIMSSNIVISFPKSGDGFLCFILFCVNFHIGFLGIKIAKDEKQVFEVPVRFKGGLCCGEILHHEQIVFGSALIESYGLQKGIDEKRKYGSEFSCIVMENTTFNEALLSVETNNQIIIKSLIKQFGDDFYIDFPHDEIISATHRQNIQNIMRSSSYEDNATPPERYVLFLDILGFKTIILGDDKNKPYRAIDVRGVFDLFLHKLYSLNKGAGILEASLVPDNVVQDIKYVVMSDSIVVSFPKSGDGFLCFVFCCLELQAGLLGISKESCNPLFDFPILLRGGLSCGEILHCEQIAFGSALIKAHDLEKVSNYPRVIMSEKTYNEGICSVATENRIVIQSFIKQDEDGYFYIDYLCENALQNETIKERINNWISEKGKDLPTKTDWMDKKIKEFERLNHLYRESLTESEYKGWLESDFRQALSKYIEFVEQHTDTESLRVIGKTN